MAFSYFQFILFGFLICFAGGEECMSVRGNVKCGTGSTGDWGRKASDHGRQREREDSDVYLDRHANPVFVKLFDEDRGGPDDWMDDGYASKTGAFQLRGCAADGLFGGSIEPVLYIYHKCKGTGKRIRFELPVQAIGTEYNISREFQLHMQQPDEVDDEYPVPTCASIRRTNARARY